MNSALLDAGGGASVRNVWRYANSTPSRLLCSSGQGAGPKNSVGVCLTTFPGEGPKSPGGTSGQRGVFTFWLSLSPLTPRGPLNFFPSAKCHPRSGGEGNLEGDRERRWRPGLGVTASGHQNTLSRLRHRGSPTGTYASASQPTSPISPRPKPLGPDPGTLTCGLHLPGAGRRALLPGRSPAALRPRSQPRCPQMRRSCAARRAPSDRAPSDRRAGQGALDSGGVLPHCHPLLPAVPVGASVRRRSRGRGDRTGGGWVRQAASLVSRRRAAGRGRQKGVQRFAGGLQRLTGVKNVRMGRRCT